MAIFNNQSPQNQKPDDSGFPHAAPEVMPQKPQKPKAPKQRENPNAGVMVRGADEFDPKKKLTPEDVARLCRDVSAEVAGGGLQIVGGVRPPAPVKEKKPAGKGGDKQPKGKPAKE